MSNNRIIYYVNRFKEIYDGEPWFGETAVLKLNQVTAEQAFQRPENNVHSVAEIVAHMIYWRNMLVKHLEGDRSYKASMENAGNWPAPEKLQKEGWDALQDQLSISQQKITELLATQKDSFLAEEYTKGSTYEYLILGIIDHDVYHLGQIGLVSRMLSGK